MAFGFLGSFRQTQWRCFRQFILNERKCVNGRLAYIAAEIERIGEITIFYERTGGVVEGVGDQLETANQVCERRTGFNITEGSTLFKLVQAYIAQGGNPAEISLWLKPDRVLWESELDPEDNPDVSQSTLINDEEVPGALNTQPGFGVVAPDNDNRSLGGADKGGWLKWGRYPFRRVGRVIDLSEADSQIAAQVDFARRWTNASIQRRNNLEARIIKLMDYREQLENEQQQALVQAVGGQVDSLPFGDPRQVHPDLAVPKIVEALDKIIYQLVPEGRTPQEKLDQQVQEIVVRKGAGVGSRDAIVQELEQFFRAQEAKQDQEITKIIKTSGADQQMIPDLNSVNLDNMKNFDSIWVDDPDDDRFSAL